MANLTVITNALNVANELVSRNEITVVLVGGSLRASELSLIGHITEQALKELRVDKLFLGMRAVSLEDGLTNDYLPEITTDRAILAMAAEVILVADNTKFGRVSTSRVAPITAVNVVVTNDLVSVDMVRQLEALNIKVLTT
jgi:DeoR/GlpR family transcriptional regulator of sugar metabolism